MQGIPQEIATYLLANWIFDYESELNGYGFPFDRAHYVFYQRMQQVQKNLEEYSLETGTPLFQLKHHLDYVLGDETLQKHTKIRKYLNYGDISKLVLQFQIYLFTKKTIAC